MTLYGSSQLAGFTPSDLLGVSDPAYLLVPEAELSGIASRVQVDLEESVQDRGVAFVVPTTNLSGVGVRLFVRIVVTHPDNISMGAFISYFNSGTGVYSGAVGETVAPLSAAGDSSPCGDGAVYTFDLTLPANGVTVPGADYVGIFFYINFDPTGLEIPEGRVSFAVDVKPAGETASDCGMAFTPDVAL